jgi:hypothetical protein
VSAETIPSAAPAPMLVAGRVMSRWVGEGRLVADPVAFSREQLFETALALGLESVLVLEYAEALSLARAPRGREQPAFRTVCIFQFVEREAQQANRAALPTEPETVS